MAQANLFDALPRDVGGAGAAVSDSQPLRPWQLVTALAFSATFGLALGARGPALTGMVVLDGLKLAAVGAACGLAAALGLSRLMAALLFGVRAADPATYALVALTLLSAATIASYLPARRVTKVDPVEALGAE